MISAFVINADILQVHKLLSMLQQKPADVGSKVLGLSGIYLASQRKDSIWDRKFYVITYSLNSMRPPYFYTICAERQILQFQW